MTKVLGTRLVDSAEAFGFMLISNFGKGHAPPASVLMMAIWQLNPRSNDGTSFSVSTSNQDAIGMPDGISGRLPEVQARFKAVSALKSQRRGPSGARLSALRALFDLAQLPDHIMCSEEQLGQPVASISQVFLSCCIRADTIEGNEIETDHPDIRLGKNRNTPRFSMKILCTAQ